MKRFAILALALTFLTGVIVTAFAQDNPPKKEDKKTKKQKKTKAKKTTG